MNPLKIVQATGAVKRKARRPVHPFYVEHRPWQLQPFFIAPVLPGETMKNLNLQARVITDPLAAGAGAILPWWCEYYFFYVKLRDLDGRAAYEQMMLKGTTIDTVDGAANAKHYHANATAPDYVAQCLKRVTEEYFRNEGETWNGAMIDGLPAVSAIQHGTNWADSLMPDGTYADTDPNDLQNPRDPTVMAEYQEQYDKMRQMRMVDMSFEDWLGTYGVNVPGPVERNKPELIRYAREWSYPTNTVDPLTGTPNSAGSWSINERADKDRFFSEPGFVFGVTSLRPKIYMGNQTSTASSMLDNAFTWLPALMRDEPHTSVREFSNLAGPLAGQTQGYWVDIRDLFIHGDQFTNTLAGLGAYAPALPNAQGEKRFATLAMAEALFKASTAAKIRQDGVVNLNVLGHPTTGWDNT